MNSIPDKYLDGCTLFPDRFGKISHKHVCIKHDIDYWTKRTALNKLVSDWEWLVNLNKAHTKNTLYWRPVIFIVSVLAYFALSTAGWYFWLNRPKFDR